jgi:DNA polymerase III alpha subunit
MTQETVALASELDLQVVATNLVTFLRAEDYILHRTLVGIQQRHHHRRVPPLPNDQYFLTSGDEMERRVPFPQALENTKYIASLCKSFVMPVGELHPPSLQEHEEASKSLAAVCLKETSRLYKPVPITYMRQLDMELQAVNRLELADFFLLVRQVVEFARSKGIRHSVRGSAAGSLVVYLLLGGVDPIAHNLLFERFINEGRADLPDIDVDFDSDRRDEVIRYLLDLLPRQTAMVCTIHKMRVRSAVRFVARSLGYPLHEIKRLATSLPWSLRGRNLLDALENLPELRDTPLHKEEQLVRLAARLTGLPFQCSVHLGGVLISPGDIKGWTPVGRSPQGLPVGQIDKDDAEALGLLKLDLLGLRMHTAIRKIYLDFACTRPFARLWKSWKKKESHWSWIASGWMTARPMRSSEPPRVLEFFSSNLRDSVACWDASSQGYSAILLRKSPCSDPGLWKATWSAYTCEEETGKKRLRCFIPTLSRSWGRPTV